MQQQNFNSAADYVVAGSFPRLRHSDARQVFDLPLGVIDMTVYDLEGSETLEEKGLARQVQDLPRISMAEPSNR